MARRKVDGQMWKPRSDPTDVVCGKCGFKKFLYPSGQLGCRECARRRYNVRRQDEEKMEKIRESRRRVARERRKRLPLTVKRAQIKVRRKRKMDALEAYSFNEPECECCKEKQFEFLTIDHMNGGGKKHRDKAGKGNSFYAWLKRHGYPPGYRVLCMNCNHAIGMYGRCPHQSER